LRNTISAESEVERKAQESKGYCVQDLINPVDVGQINAFPGLMTYREDGKHQKQWNQIR